MIIDDGKQIDISIHAPTRGATEKSEFHCTLGEISIHAPTRGATKRLVIQHLLVNFNPRSHERSDGMPISITPTGLEFQSTLPREERQQYCTKNLFIFIQYRQ